MGVGKGSALNVAIWIRLIYPAIPWLTILEENPTDLNEAERRYIAKFRSIGLNLRNMTDGGGGGSVHSEESKIKLSIALKGKTLSHETRAKISAGHMGNVLSSETRAKISAALKGKTLSPETRAKMSASHMGKKHPIKLKAKLPKIKQNKFWGT